MKRLSISNVHQREAAKLFFDFYSMSLLRFYAGKNSLNHACRIRRIEEAYEQVVEKFYSEVRRCLHYSVLREFRHFRYETYETESDSYKHKFPYGQLVRLSRKLSTQFDNGSLDKFLEGRGQLKEDYPLDQIVDGYFNHEWGCSYGGEAWGEAARFLTEHPKTLAKKELWIDRVLDLQHNCGHILNKTKYSILTEGVGIRKNPKKTYTRCILDHRRYAKRMKDLSFYASFKTQKLVGANLNNLPEIIR